MKPTVTFHSNCEKASKTAATEEHCSWVVEQQPSVELPYWSAAMGFVRLLTGCTHFLPESSIKRKKNRQLYIEPKTSLAFEFKKRTTTKKYGLEI